MTNERMASEQQQQKQKIQSKTDYFLNGAVNLTDWPWLGCVWVMCGYAKHCTLLTNISLALLILENSH